MNEVMRQEKKYLIHLADMARLSGALSQVMAQDRHGGALGYRIRSLYFDTLRHAVKRVFLFVEDRTESRFCAAVAFLSLFLIFNII